METMENKVDEIKLLAEKAEAYGKTNFDLLKLKAVDKTANLLAIIVSRATALLLIFLFITIASIGVALWLGETLGKPYYGFFYVSGFYGFFGIILYFFKENWIKKSVNNSIISQVLN